MWRPVLHELGGRVRAIVPDLPGHGKSVSVHYVSHHDTVTRLADLLADRAPRGAIVVGFSLGGQLAIDLASAYPSLVRGALIISAETKPAPAQGATLSLLKGTAPLAKREWFAKKQAKQLGVPEEFLAEYIRDSQSLSRETLLASVGENIAYTIPASWQHFRRPVTVAVGERERRLMRRSAHLTHEGLPHSELVVIPEAGHDAPFMKPNFVADLIRALVVQTQPKHAA